VLDNPGALKEGTSVEVHPIKKRKRPAKPRKPKSKVRRRSLAEHLAPFVGIVKDMPADMSVNLDHYLYGQPKV
jgi:hypothetical protein